MRSDDRSLLHLAAAQGSLEIVSMLVNSGAAIHAVDRWGRTPLDDAVAAGHAEVVQFLEPHAKQVGTWGAIWGAGRELGNCWGRQVREGLWGLNAAPKGWRCSEAMCG